MRTYCEIHAHANKLDAYIDLPHVGQTARFPFEKGGKQGGVETPDMWRALVDFVMEPLVRAWQEQRVGFNLLQEDGQDETIISHAVGPPSRICS